VYCCFPCASMNVNNWERAISSRLGAISRRRKNRFHLLKREHPQPAKKGPMQNAFQYVCKCKPRFSLHHIDEVSCMSTDRRGFHLDEVRRPKPRIVEKAIQFFA
jgi:hypothetical protein